MCEHKDLLVCLMQNHKPNFSPTSISKRFSLSSSRQTCWTTEEQSNLRVNLFSPGELSSSELSPAGRQADSTVAWTVRHSSSWKQTLKTTGALDGKHGQRNRAGAWKALTWDLQLLIHAIQEVKAGLLQTLALKLRLYAIWYVQTKLKLCEEQSEESPLHY